jgi:excisionase family DNA binding protein
MNETSDGDVDQCVSLLRAAKILGVCVRTVRREIERGKIIAFRVGRNLRIKMSELRRYIERELAGVSSYSFFGRNVA